MSRKTKTLSAGTNLLFCPFSGTSDVVSVRAKPETVVNLGEAFSKAHQGRPVIVFKVVADDDDPNSKFLQTRDAHDEIDPVLFLALKQLSAQRNLEIMFRLKNKPSVIINAETTEETFNTTLSAVQATFAPKTP